MKKILLILTLITIGSLTSQAQSHELRGNANWVVQSNEKTPKIQTVNFYDNEHELIYSETIHSRLNISRKKVQRTLNRVLESLLTQDSCRKSKDLLAVSFKMKH